jgi:hypothetical protein
MITESTKKSLKDCDIVNIWAHSVPLMRQLMKDDGLYLDELFLLSTVYRLVSAKGKAVAQRDIFSNFNILSYKREVMIKNLIKRGYLDNNGGVKGAFQAYSFNITIAGEQLLLKYRKILEKLCNEV